MRNYQEITPLEMDMLKEAGNIASGNAMTSLSTLIGATLDMSVAQVKIEQIQNLPTVLGGADAVVSGMLIHIFGDLKAMLLLSFETESTLTIVNRMTWQNLTTLKELGEMEYSALCEIGNILAGTYLNALNKFTGLMLDISPPQMAIDMAGAILSYPAIEFTLEDNSMLFIKTDFQDMNGLVNGTYILILDNISYNKILDSMGANL